MRYPRSLSHLISLTVLALMVGMVAPAAAAPAPGPIPKVTIKPTTLPRGGDVAVPHVEGTTLVDGAVRIPVAATRVDLLGRVGADYLVAARDDSGSGPVLRISPDGTRRTVLTPSANGDEVVVSRDGSRLAQAKVKGGFRSSVVTVWSSTDGSVLARKKLPGIQSVLDLDQRIVVLGSDIATSVWSTGSGEVTTSTSRRGYVADIAANRLASFDGDPYNGGCTVVTTLVKPGRKLWRSCSERVETFSPNGSRMASVDLLADGIGPSQVVVRSAVGVAKGAYRIRGYFGQLLWESNAALLLDSYGRSQGAMVRCSAATCVRATELVPTPDYRRAA